MANAARTGFWPVADRIGTAIQTRRERMASNNGTAFFWGDCMLKGTAAGVWGLATAGGGVSGVFQGGSILDTTQLVRKEVVFVPASTTYSGTAFDFYGETDNSFIYVTSDYQGLHFECQAKAATTGALTDVTKTANFSAGAGSTTTGISGHLLDTLGTSTGSDFAVRDIKRSVDNDPTLVNFKFIVQINNPGLPPAAAGQ